VFGGITVPGLTSMAGGRLLIKGTATIRNHVSSTSWIFFGIVETIIKLN
jgi:hypothetical protein